ncbi:sensor histidine kinase [Streptomyces sp. SID3343]|uniref:sensor histidine kinase n=1 Tax=Streptomyces sp. SID3343 TaxID=2690260 RepID=UPI0019278D91|nr:sensor histidine kinase [Streptomyces sp. SID3343]
MYPTVLTPVLRALRICMHALVALLLVLAAVRAVVGDDVSGGWAALIVGAVVVTGGVYAAGDLVPAVGRSRRASVVWLAALTLCWFGLYALTAEGIWLAFPLFFLYPHLLPLRFALPSVAVLTAVAVTGYAAHEGGVTPGMVLGPILGAGVAVATVLGYQALYRENEERRRLVEDVVAARTSLAAAERHAGVLAERERLAREIHDTLAQGFSSIQLLLRAAERALPGDPVGADRHVRLARVTATDNLAEARRFVRALAPSELEGSSLSAALERLCARTAAEAGLDVRFHRTGEAAELPTAYEVALLRIAQSALGNTVRHAAAGRVEVTLSHMDASVTLDVVDDGRGFDPAVPPGRTGSSGTGFGIEAMRTRAAELGGALTVEAAPGQGTAVAASFPVVAR